jgi:hypothetical protein
LFAADKFKKKQSKNVGFSWLVRNAKINHCVEVQHKLSSRKREQHLSFKIIYNLSTYFTKNMLKMNRKVKHTEKRKELTYQPNS